MENWIRYKSINGPMVRRYEKTPATEVEKDGYTRSQKKS